MLIAQIGGNVSPEAVWFATERAYEDAFISCGHDVVPINQKDLCRDEVSVAVDTILTRCSGRVPDLIVYTRTHNDTALLPKHTGIWRQFEDRGAKTASVHLDVYWGIPEREQWMREGDPLFTTGTVFTADGGSDKHWEELGIHHVWLPPGGDLRRSRPFDEVAPDPDLTDKVVFVGSRGYHKRYQWRPALIDMLERTYRDRFVWYGGGSPLGTVRGEDLDRVYASDCVIVGDQCFAAEGKRTHYWSDRTPETLGRGGLLLQPFVEGMTDWYTDDDLVYYRPGDFDWLNEKIEKTLAWPTADRLDIRRHGAATVRGRDTYPMRAATMLDDLGF